MEVTFKNFLKYLVRPKQNNPKKVTQSGFISCFQGMVRLVLKSFWIKTFYENFSETFSKYLIYKSLKNDMLQDLNLQKPPSIL